MRYANNPGGGEPSPTSKRQERLNVPAADDILGRSSANHATRLPCSQSASLVAPACSASSAWPLLLQPLLRSHLVGSPTAQVTHQIQRPSCMHCVVYTCLLKPLVCFHHGFCPTPEARPQDRIAQRPGFVQWLALTWSPTMWSSTVSTPRWPDGFKTVNSSLLVQSHLRFHGALSPSS